MMGVRASRLPLGRGTKSDRQRMAAVERLIEGVPGETAEVWVQERGGGALRLRGEVVIEDLRPVLTSIASRSGANGPQNPVTQFMLREASSRLAERLVGDHRLNGPRSTDHVPRLLSSALGHQPFIETTLQMSQHQMLRRWPQASAWYTDVITYMLRSSRYTDIDRQLTAQTPTWATDTLGGFIRRLSDQASMIGHHHNERRVAEALQILWPDFPPVQRAISNRKDDLRRRWLPLCAATLTAYGLRLRHGVTPEMVIWTIDALNERASMEKLSGLATPQSIAAGQTWSASAWASLVVLSGACEDDQGNAFSPSELAARESVRPLQLASA